MENSKKTFNIGSSFKRVTQAMFSAPLPHAKLYAATLMWCYAGTVGAHEYWLESVTSKPKQSPSIELIARVGEGLQSDRFQPFSADSYQRLWVNGSQALKSNVRLADDKNVMVIEPNDSNTNSVAYQEKPALHRYNKFEEFILFAKEEGVEHIVEQHLASDLPKAHFYEQFTRHTKALFCSVPEPTAKEPSNNSNTPIDYEWIAQDNVHSPDTTVVQLQLLKDNEPLAERPVTVFAEYDGEDEVKRIRLKTDDKGVVLIDNKPGRYLVNSTVVHRADRDVTLATGAIWESHWVSLTFNNQC